MQMRDLIPPAATALGDRVRVRRAAHQVRERLQGHTRLHLGCGNHLLAGWANLDFGVADGVIRCDLTQPLPVDPESIDAIFTEHFIEHITRAEAQRLLADCHRVLKRGGVMRISTPNLEALVEQYRLRRTTEWSDVGWAPDSPCALLNEGLRSWGHQYVYDADELGAMLAAAGFSSIARVGWHESGHAALRSLETRPFHNDLILEATRTT
jgi:predicted SAM-dependent methyltransferase